MRGKNSEQESTIFLTTAENIRLKVRVKTMKEKLMSFSKRGSMKAICYQLNKAVDENKLDDKIVLKDILELCASNFHKQKQGKRYKQSVQQFYEVLMYWGGPRIATFVAENIFGPEIHSIYRWRKKNALKLFDGLHEENFKTIADIYKKAIEDLNDLNLSRVPVEFAEDETGIIKKICYDERTDQLVGFCGMKGEEHTCTANDAATVITIGDGESGYENIVKAFENFEKGSYARVIMINPIHPNLPKLVIFTMVTCNCFDSDMVKQQYKDNLRLYQEHIEPVLGPAIGIASDGDSRRRKLMLELMTGTNGDRYQPVPRTLGFIFTAKRCNDGELKDLCDQDFIHNHKKLINHLDHKSRNIKMGNYLVHLNYVREVYNKFSPHEHGLTKSDIDRDNRQNWRSAQLMLDLNIPANKGTCTYLNIVWYYVEIFCSETANLYTRIKHASIVVTFLGIWRNWICVTPRLSLKENFISRETYIDIITSCHFAVSYICYCRDCFPEMECHLKESGTDCNETHFSTIGQWVGNKHNYTYHDMRRNATHCMRIERLRSDPSGPKFCKPHPKGECIWYKQYAEGYVKVDLKEYPELGAEVAAWKEGISCAQTLAVSVGMSPKNNTQTVDWFHRPFSYVGNTFTSKEVDEMDNFEDSDEEVEVDDASDDIDLTIEAFGEVIDALPSAEGLHNCKALDDNTCDTGRKISPKVKIPNSNGKEIYKATLVQLLNDDPKMSMERLVRVRQRNEYNRVEKQTNLDMGDTPSVCLYNDYVILDHLARSYFVGRVERMVRKSGKGKIEYKRPEPMDSVNKNDITVTFAIYNLLNKEEKDVDLLMTDDSVKLRNFQFKDIVSEVNLVVLDDILTLPSEERNVIELNVSRRFPTRKQKPKSQSLVATENENCENDDGSVSVMIKPTTVADGSRLSTRERKVKVYDDLM